MQPSDAGGEAERPARTASRPAFYAMRSGGWRDYVTLVHPPYTAWHLSYVALGASVIEKHITLGRNLPGPDHRASIEPDELRALVTRYMSQG